MEKEHTVCLRDIMKKAQNFYQEQLANNVNDVEMDRLKELYDQAVSNGWIQ